MNARPRALRWTTACARGTRRTWRSACCTAARWATCARTARSRSSRTGAPTAPTSWRSCPASTRCPGSASRRAPPSRPLPLPHLLGTCLSILPDVGPRTLLSSRLPRLGQIHARRLPLHEVVPCDRRAPGQRGQARLHALACGPRPAGSRGAGATAAGRAQVARVCEAAVQCWWEDTHPGWMIFTLGNQHFQSLDEIIQARPDQAAWPGGSGSGSRRVSYQAARGRARRPAARAARLRPCRAAALLARAALCCVGAATGRQAGADACVRARGCSTRRWTARQAWWRPCRHSWTAATARCCPGAVRAPWALVTALQVRTLYVPYLEVWLPCLVWPTSGGAQARARRPRGAGRAGAHAAGGALASRLRGWRTP